MTIFGTASTTIAHPVGPDVTGYGAAELAYAISLTDGVHRSQAAEFLQVSEAFLTEQIIAIGASSLLARGELTVRGDSLVAGGGLRLLSATLQTATRWTEIALITDVGAEAAVYVQAPDLSVFLQPVSLGAWEIVVKAPEATDSALLKQIIDGSIERHSVGVVYFGTETADAERNHLFVRATYEGRWDVADVADVEPAGEQNRTDGVDTAALIDTLAAFVALPAA